MPAQSLLLIAVLLSLCSCTADKPSPTARDNIERLRRLDAALAQPSGSPIPDEVVFEAFAAIEQDITDDQLPDLEGYALSKGTRDVRWPIADLFADRGRYDSAARIYVAALVDRPGPRENGMWKHWEYMFGRRDDYEQMGRMLVDALLNLYADATPEQRLVIAELFGLPPDAAKLSPPRFRDIFEQREKLP